MRRHFRPSWGGATNPVSAEARLLFAGSEGRVDPPEGVGFSVALRRAEDSSLAPARVLRDGRPLPDPEFAEPVGITAVPSHARLLGEQVTGKTIVLTGAMVPYKFGSSDGLFNLGSALSFVQALP